MSGLSKEQLAELSWCDVELRGITWIEGGRDLQFELQPPSSGRGTSEKSRRTLCARWVRGLRVDLHQAEDAGGYPLTWDVVFEQERPGVWSVQFDFGSAGSVSFKCSELGAGDA